MPTFRNMLRQMIKVPIKRGDKLEYLRVSAKRNFSCAEDEVTPTINNLLERKIIRQIKTKSDVSSTKSKKTPTAKDKK